MLLHYTGANSFKAPPPPDAVEVRAGEITGWRVWHVREHFSTRDLAPHVPRLFSVYMEDFVWPATGPARGNPLLRSGSDDSTPQGVYAWKTEDLAHAYSLEQRTVCYSAIGKVDLWGRVIEHEKGYRAEYARVASIEIVHGPDLRYAGRPPADLVAFKCARYTEQLRFAYGV